jgi:hypothetical protein
MDLVEYVLSFALGIGCALLSKVIARRLGIHWDSEKRDRIGVGLLLIGLFLAWYLTWPVFLALLLGAAVSLYGPDIRRWIASRDNDDNT